MINEKATSFKNLILNNTYITGVGARDALEAKMIERAGFDFVWSSGFCISASYGLPDASFLSMKTFVEEALAIKEAINIPIFMMPIRVMATP